MFGKTIFFLLGVLATYSFSVLALTAELEQDIQSEQEYSLKYTGSYSPIYEKDYQVFTYEGICKGYYVITDNGVEKRSVGFGDLADEYTFVEKYPVVDTLQATSTLPVDEKPIDTEPAIDTNAVPS